MRIVICGSRYWKDQRAITETLNHYAAPDSVVIDGAAQGADKLGHRAALALGFKTLRFKADWNRLGRAAGIIRNQRMITVGKPDLVLAFLCADKENRGTKDMIGRAKTAGINVIETWDATPVG